MKTGKSLNIEKKKYTKSTLPTKICAVCKLPFAWRKKWAKDWENVKFCSERCRRGKADE
ncbi:MAG: DUF2256 domain-containing protein [Acidobacteriota bacterium]|nr:DUF2256 domain-containing protein [Acidobacteriota bacterium]